MLTATATALAARAAKVMNGIADHGHFACLRANRTRKGRHGATVRLGPEDQAARFSGKGGRPYGEVVEEQTAEMKRLNDYLEKSGATNEERFLRIEDDGA